MSPTDNIDFYDEGEIPVNPSSAAEGKFLVERGTGAVYIVGDDDDYVGGGPAFVAGAASGGGVAAGFLDTNDGNTAGQAFDTWNNAGIETAGLGGDNAVFTVSLQESVTNPFDYPIAIIATVVGAIVEWSVASDADDFSIEYVSTISSGTNFLANGESGDRLVTVQRSVSNGVGRIARTQNSGVVAGILPAGVTDVVELTDRFIARAEGGSVSGPITANIITTENYARLTLVAVPASLVA